MENIFKILNAVNVNEFTEKKNKLTYLSWAWAWAKVKESYPNATFEIWKNENHLPYICDENLGYMVFTSVKIQDLTHECWLPVMDGRNKAMKKQDYKYKTKEGDRVVLAATMFDVNKAIMRCLVKNLAMFGLGLYIYAKEDLPEPTLEVSDISLDEAKTVKELTKIYNENINKVKDKVSFTKQLGIKRAEIEEAKNDL